MNKKDINQIFAWFTQTNPNPKTELEFNSAFECLIAVMLSAQTTDIQVNKVTKKLYALANTPKAMLELGEQKIIEQIRHIGLFRNKAKNLLGISQMLISEYDSQVPNNLEALQKLPGVGRKTALVVMSAVFGEATIAVDTHVHRVSHRIGLVKNCKTPLKTEQQLLKTIPKQYLFYAHHHLILHGRYICKARKPDCENCGIKALCVYYNSAQTKKS